MSIFKSEVKLTSEIFDGYNKCDYANFHGGQKWVPLEVAIARLDEINQECNALGEQLGYVSDLNNALREHIETANRSLDNLLEILPKGNNIQVIINKTELINLKKILANEKTQGEQK